ncbi:MAG: hypothetical protein ACHQEA_14060 [Gaiellales bacterium]
MFGAFFVGFAVFWEYSAVSGDAGWFFVLFGAGFVVLGLRGVVWPPLAHRRRLRSTWYAVTDQRVIAVYERGSGPPEVNGAFLRNLPGVTVRHGRSGRGSVFFASNAPGFMPSDDAKAERTLGFVDIPDPDAVARIITGAMRTTDGTASG